MPTNPQMKCDCYQKTLIKDRGWGTLQWKEELIILCPCPLPLRKEGDKEDMLLVFS